MVSELVFGTLWYSKISSSVVVATKSDSVLESRSFDDFSAKTLSAYIMVQNTTNGSMFYITRKGVRISSIQDKKSSLQFSRLKSLLTILAQAIFEVTFINIFTASMGIIKEYVIILRDFAHFGN